MEKEFLNVTSLYIKMGKKQCVKIKNSQLQMVLSVPGCIPTYPK